MQGISVILELCGRWISCSSPLLVLFCGCSCVCESWGQPGKCPLFLCRKGRRASMNSINKLVSQRGLAAVLTQALQPENLGVPGHGPCRRRTVLGGCNQCDQLMEADCLSLCAPHAKNSRVSWEGYDVGWKACVWAERYDSSLFLGEMLRKPSTLGARTQHTVSQVLQPLRRCMVSSGRTGIPRGVWECETWWVMQLLSQVSYKAGCVLGVSLTE